MTTRPGVVGFVLVLWGTGYFPCQAEEPAIPPAYIEVSRAFDIPPRILYAVAWTESGLRLTSNQIRPWPWTLNIHGQEERYASRQAAWQAIQNHLAAGRRSIDIGLMQINWRWHGKTLGDSWQALDPLHNLRTGAQLLRDLYRESGDWSVAIGRYHAPAATRQARARAKAYRARVRRRLAQLEKSLH
jgi:hypothetical protein